MAEKTKPPQPKNIPKDGQVILAILKEMGVTEYEPKTLVQLTEFVYRYGTSILEEAKAFANSSKKKNIDLDDVHLALELSAESAFTHPPPREVLIDCARTKNSNSLPLVKPYCGLRLPADRHCLSSCNYALRGTHKKNIKTGYTMGGNSPAMKVATKSNVSFVKRAGNAGAGKQVVTVPKPMTKIINSTVQQQKTVLKPKIQIAQGDQVMVGSGGDSGADMMVDGTMKRKREDEMDGKSFSS